MKTQVISWAETDMPSKIAKATTTAVDLHSVVMLLDLLLVSFIEFPVVVTFSSNCLCFSTLKFIKSKNVAWCRNQLHFKQILQSIATNDPPYTWSKGKGKSNTQYIVDYYVNVKHTPNKLMHSWSASKHLSFLFIIKHFGSIQMQRNIII